MNYDRTLCDLTTCIHRRGCERYIAPQEMNYLPPRRSFFSNPQTDCVESEPYPYQYLIRYQTSDKEPS